MEGIMKKLLKITALIFLLLVFGTSAWIWWMKDRIVQRIKEDINNQLTAQVDFGPARMSLFKHFPDLYLEVDSITVTNRDSVFDGIRLADIGRFGLTLDLKALWNRQTEIKDILLQDARFRVYVTRDGRANYDIVKNNDTETGTDTPTAPFEWKLKHYLARNINLLYADTSMGLRLYTSGLVHEGSSVIADDGYTVTGSGKADTVDVIYDDIHYLHNARLTATDTIIISSDLDRYTFKQISGTVNELPVYFDGELAMLPSDEMEMHLRFGTGEASLAQLLSLIPPQSMEQPENMDIQGLARLDGTVDGRYNDSLYPAYRIRFTIDRGRIKAKDLPESIDDIHLMSRVDFPGGSNLDATAIDLPQIAFRVAGQPAQGHLSVRYPMSDPLINTAFKTHLDLSAFKKALPLRGIQRLEGILDADFAVKGRVSAMENQAADQLEARGYINMKDFALAGDSLPYPVAIPEARTAITPRAWQVERLRLQAGQSDFDIQGQARNYLAYLTGKDSVLHASFSNTSRLIDANELMAAAGEDDTSQDTLPLRAPRIPAGLDIRLESRADRMLYKDMVINDSKATLQIRDQKAAISTALLKAFGGEIDLRGLYDTSDSLPYSSLDLRMKKLQLDQTARSLSLMKHYAPILQKIKGYMDMGLQLGLNLDENLNPVLSTTDASGEVATGTLMPENVEFFKSAANILQLKALENPVIKGARARFAIQDGTLNIKPFDFTVNGMKSTLGGKVMLDRTLDLQWDLAIPVEKLGTQANRWLQQFSGELNRLGIPLDQIRTIYVTLHITGPLTHPQIRPVFKKGQGMQGLEETVRATVQQQAQQLIDSTKQQLSRQAEQWIREAEIRGDRLIRQAEEAALKIREEADQKARELEEKATTPLEKFAARKAAEKIRQEADRQARQLVEKARAEKQKLIEEARRKAREALEKTPKLKNE